MSRSPWTFDRLLLAALRRRQGARPRLRWHSFARSHRACGAPDSRVAGLSAGQLGVLRKLSLLRVSAALERHSNSSWTSKNWLVAGSDASKLLLLCLFLLLMNV